MDRLTYTLPEVAEATGQSIHTVKAHAKAGLLPTVQPGGGRRLVLAEDLRAYLAGDTEDAEEMR